MPLFPAGKLNDSVIGIDFHSVMIPPAPAPIPFLPHPYFGPILLWYTPTFPKTDVFINGQPAVSVGAMGMFCHIPMGLPAPPGFPNLLAYWKRHILCIPKTLGLALLTLFANIAISMISALIPKPPTPSCSSPTTSWSASTTTATASRSSSTSSGSTAAPRP